MLTKRMAGVLNKNSVNKIRGEKNYPVSSILGRVSAGLTDILKILLSSE